MKNPRFPEFSQKDTTREFHQLRPRSLRSNGTQLDEVIGDIQDARKPISDVAHDALGLPLMTPATERLAKKSRPGNALDEPEADSDHRIRRGSR